MKYQSTFIGFLCVFACCAAANAQDKKITFDDHIKPLFRAKCASCHNGDKKSGGLDVTNFTNLMQGGSSGAVIEPGDAAESYLFQLVNHDEEPIMPPNSDKLPDKQVKLIEDWIDNGALENKKSVSAAPKKKKMVTIVESEAGKRPAVVPHFPRLSLEPVTTSKRKTGVPAMATHPWAPIAAVSSMRQILLVNLQSNQLVGILPFPEGQANVLKFSRNGSLLLAGGGQSGASGKVIVWDVKSGKRMITVGDELETVLAADISNDQSLIALGGPQKMVRVYDTSTGKLEYQIKKHTDWVTSLEFSPDGVLLATGDRNGGVYVWEAETGNEYLTLKGHTKRITSISWRIDSNVVATASEDVSIRLWELENGRLIKSWGAHGRGVSDMKFVRDGKIVSCGRDRAAKVWDQSGKQIRAFGGLTDIAVSCAFCCETQRVLVSDWAGEMRLYQSTDGKLVGSPQMNPPKVSERLAFWNARKAEFVKQVQPLKNAADQSAKQLTALKTKQSAEKTKLTQTQNELNRKNGEIQATQQFLTKTQTNIQNLKKLLTGNQQAKPLVAQTLAKAKEALVKLPNDATLQNTVNEMTKKIQSIDLLVTKLTNQIKTEQQKLVTGQSKMKQLSTVATQLNTSKSNIVKSVAAIDQQMPTVSQRNAQTQKSYQNVQSQLKAVEQQILRWQNELDFLKKLQELNANLSAAQKQFESASQVVAQREKELKAAAQNLTHAKASADQMRKQVESVEQELQKVHNIK